MLDAVVRIVARDGLESLTYRSVAAEAGVTHGLVSYHFASREAMIVEALGRAARAAISTASIAPTEGHDIRDFAANLSTLIAEDPDGQAFQHHLKLEALRRPEIADQVRGMRQTYLDNVQDALVDLGLDADEALARLVLAVLDGLVIQQLVSGQPEATEMAVRRLHSLLELSRSHGPFDELDAGDGPNDGRPVSERRRSPAP